MKPVLKALFVHMSMAAMILLSGLSSAQTSSEALSSSSMVIIQDAVEAQYVELVADNSDSIVGVRAGRCHGCAIRSFLPAPDMTFMLGQDKIDTAKALAINGQPATVIYNARSGLAEAVNFFAR